MNYIGSKYSLLDFIAETISSVTGCTQGQNLVFGDLFAGTGVVGSYYRQLGYRVISNDIQYYSYVINKHYIENNKPINKKIVENLNKLPGKKGFIYKNFCLGSGSGRNYFNDANGKKCDAIRQEIEKLYKNKKISRLHYFSLLGSLVNSIDKYANTASVYGAFLKHLKKSAQKPFVLTPLSTIEGPKGKVYNTDTSILIEKIKGDILYLDPPYNARQYCTNYHVLETISKYDNPTLFGITGLRKEENQKSEFCSRRNVKKVFEHLIAKAQFKYIFLSYNNEGLMDLATIQQIMSKYGEYKIFTKEYKRFQADKTANRNINSFSTTEYLHCLIRK